MPKRPDPNHPLADAAQDEAQAIAAMSTPASDTPPVPPVEPVAPVQTSTPADDTPPADEPPATPIDERFSRMEARFDSLLGRHQQTYERAEELAKVNDTLAKNVEFTKSKLTEQQELIERLTREKRDLEYERESILTGREFKSELVDADQFGEIMRGITPALRRRDERIETLVSEIQGLRKAIDDTRSKADERVAGVRKEITERMLLRDEPDFQKMLERKDFKDFLAERIPGARRTRYQEVVAAYEDGDTAFLKSVADDFRRRGHPSSVDSGIQQPPRAPGEQTPRAPKREEPVSDDQLQAAHEAFLRDEITPAQFREIRQRHKATSAKVR